MPIIQSKILLLDMGESAYNFLSRRLQRKGYDLFEGDWYGSKACEEATAYQPDLIIFSLLYPDDCFRLAQKFALIPATADIPKIGLFHESMLNSQVKSTAEKLLDGYFQTPVNFPDLLELIETLLNRSEGA